MDIKSKKWKDTKKESKEIHTKTYYNQIVKSQKQNILKAERERKKGEGEKKNGRDLSHKRDPP